MRGAGRAIVEFLLGMARARGASDAMLLVNPANVAGRAFYTRLGFECYAIAMRRSLIG